MQNNKDHFLDSKTLIAIVFLIISWLGWDHYMRKKYPSAPAKKQETPLVSDLKIEDKEEIKSPKINPPLKEYREKFLEFKGKNMEILFSSKGFGIKQLKLVSYQNRQKEPVVFIAQEIPLFSSLFLENTEQVVPFQIQKQGNLFVGVFSSPQGTIKKTFFVDEDRFVLTVKMEIEPEIKNFKGISLIFSHPLPKEESKAFLSLFLIYGQEILKGFASYEGDQHKQVSVAEMEENPGYKNVKAAALGGKYFGKAFINDSSFLPSVVFKKDKTLASAQVDYEFLHSKPQNLSYRIFLGPKSLKNLQKLGKGELRAWLDFGFFGWLARPLLLFLNGLYNLCHNWGLAIILLTFFIRLSLLPINIKSYRSMKIMQKIQPQIQEIKEKHKSDPKQVNTEVMALMKKHKANPIGGCFPLFLQFPVFIALYRVLGESIELYQSPFILWIEDLSLKDPYYVLPILAGLVYFVQQSITPMNLPKEQARLIKIMPLIFSVFMLALPSGLTLYLFVSGLFGLVQQFFFVKIKSSHLKGGEDAKTV